MSILGIWDGHDAGAALIVGDRLVAAVNEERFTRRKLEPRFPVRSIRCCLEMSEVSAVEGISTSWPSPLRISPRRWHDGSRA